MTLPDWLVYDWWVVRDWVHAMVASADPLDVVTDIALAVLVASVAMFIGFYASRSPWTATLQGQFLMAQKWSMGLLALHFLVGAIWRYPGFFIVQAVLVCFLALTSAVMLVGLLLAQTEQRPVSKRHGTGIVPPEDVESTLQTRRREARR